MKRNLIFTGVLALLLLSYLFSQKINSVKEGMSINEVREISKPDAILYKGDLTNYIYRSKRIWFVNGIKDSLVISLKNDTVVKIKRW